MNKNLEIITLAGGCFWCTETIFKSLKGVLNVEPGYSGGSKTKPNYWDISTGKTGHAESVQITFDPNVISLKAILEVFFKIHDPTQLNRQGVDLGTQYRSAIFFNSNEQKKTAEDILKKAQKNFQEKIVTEISRFMNFFKATEEHRNYYLKNKGNIYCTLVIDPKIQKLKKEFGMLIKK